jgi:hypothetical protein
VYFAEGSRYDETGFHAKVNVSYCSLRNRSLLFFSDLAGKVKLPAIFLDTFAASSLFSNRFSSASVTLSSPRYLCHVLTGKCQVTIVKHKP